ncbi:MAG: TraR/DksA C4-type zinc finger protein [Candidatus Moranbacteria bacterium]|nr:TraR/DksA C4-type zinc finger protein [Candidatus Moranbacteria bacterium]
MNEEKTAALRKQLVIIARTMLLQIHDIIPEDPLGNFKGGEGIESEGMIVEYSQNAVDVNRKENAVEIIADCLRSIEKIDEGSYGACDECDEHILPERLRMYPYSTLCTKCKGEQEKARKHMHLVSDKGPGSCVSVKVLMQRLDHCIAHA